MPSRASNWITFIMKIFSFLFLLLVQSAFAEYPYELSICAIFRNEASYLKEWIEFHHLVGVQHFYLCSHNSHDSYKEVLAPYIQSGLVELIEIETQEGENPIEFFTLHVQCKFYTDCLNKSRGESKWIAFLDSDEFLFPAEEETLLTVLKEYEGAPGIGVNWQMFGTSWVQKVKPHECMIERLTRCAPTDHRENKHIKSIIRPEYAIDLINPHFARFREGAGQVNTDHVSFGGPFSPYIQVDKLRINHYWLRDESFLRHDKLPRRIRWGCPIESVMKYHREYNQEENRSILRYVPRLKERLGM